MRYCGHSILLAVLFLGGCASLTSPARIHKLKSGQSYWFDYVASRRGAYMFSKDPNQVDPFCFCAEPSPDVALEILSKFKLKADYREIGGEGEAELQQKVVQLAKRTQTIMFLRESLYRLCELSVNTSADPNTVSSLYKTVIDAAGDMAKAAALEAEKDMLDAKRKAMAQIKTATQEPLLKGLRSRYYQLISLPLRTEEVLSSGAKTTDAELYAEDLAEQLAPGETPENIMFHGPVDKAQKIVDELEKRVRK